MLVHLYVVDSFLLRHLLDVVHRDALQNLDEQNLDVHLPYLDVVLHLAGVVADEELRHQLRMDYFLDVVGEELQHQLRMDYFLDEVQLESKELQVLQHHSVRHLLLQLRHDFLQQAFQHRVMPSTPQDLHLALRQVLLQALDLLLQSSLRQSSSLQLS
jgi:hypothetical protein